MTVHSMSNPKAFIKDAKKVHVTYEFLQEAILCVGEQACSRMFIGKCIRGGGNCQSAASIKNWIATFQYVLDHPNEKDKDPYQARCLEPNDTWYDFVKLIKTPITEEERNNWNNVSLLKLGDIAISHGITFGVRNNKAIQTLRDRMNSMFERRQKLIWNIVEPEIEDDKVDYRLMNVFKLRDLCKNRGIPSSGLKKDQMIQLLNNSIDTELPRNQVERKQECSTCIELKIQIEQLLRENNILKNQVKQKQESQVVSVDKSYKPEEYTEPEQKQESQIITLKQGGILKFNNIEIQCRSSDGMINLTQLAKASGNRLDHYMASNETKAYLEALNKLPEFRGVKIITSVEGRGGGTWAHRLVAYHYAQKLSPQFAVQVNYWLDNMQQENKINTQAVVNLQEENKSYQTEKHAESEQKQESQIIPLKQGGVLKFNNIEIQCRSSDGMINLTQLAKASGNRLDHYMASNETKAYLEALKAIPEFRGSLLINTCKGGKSNEQGTWAHRLVAYHYAQKLSPQFAVQVSCWLDNLFLTGQVKIGEEKSQKELDTIWKNKCLQLEAEYNDLKTKIIDASCVIKKLKYKVSQHERRHKYYNLGIDGPMFYLVEFNDGILKPGIAGINGKNNLDDRLRQHRTTEPALKLRFAVAGSAALIKRLEENIQFRYEKERVASSHEELQNLTVHEVVETIKMLLSGCARPGEWNIIPRDKIKLYNDSVDETIKLR